MGMFKDIKNLVAPPEAERALKSKFYTRAMAKKLDELLDEGNDALKKLVATTKYPKDKVVVDALDLGPEITEQEDADQIFSTVKQPVMDLLGINPDSDPNVYLRRSGLEETLKFNYKQHLGAAGLGAALGLINKNKSSALIMPILYGASSVITDVFFNKSSSGRAYDGGNLAISKGKQVIVTETIAHEYTHFARYKKSEDFYLPTIDEGLATAVGLQICKNFDKSKVEYEIFADTLATNWLRMAYSDLTHRLGVPARKDTEKLGTANFMISRYVVGFAGFAAAHKKHGDIIYKEALQDKYDALLS